MDRAPKVELRPLVAEDRDRLRAWRNLPAVRRWMFTDHEIGEVEHGRWFAKVLAEPTARHWIISADGAPVGLIHLHDIDAAASRGTWGFYIADEHMRGKGIGAAAHYAVIDKAFGDFGLHKLWSETVADNKAVITLHESFGFTREAVFRDHLRKDGGWIDVIGFGLLAEDWAARREAVRDQLLARGFAV